MANEIVFPSITVQGGLGYTFVSRARPLTNGATYTHIAVFLANVTGAKVKILRRVSPGVYDVLFDTPAVGAASQLWALVELSPQYVVPATGDYFAGAWFPASGVMGVISAEARSYLASDATGSGVSLTEDTNPTGAVFPVLAANATVTDPDTIVSSAGGNWDNANCVPAKILAPNGFGLGETGTAVEEAHTDDEVIDTANVAGNYVVSTLANSLIANGTSWGLGYIGTANAVSANSIIDTAGGNYVTVAANLIVAPTPFGIGQTGTFDEAARNTDPGTANVLNAIPYIIQGANKVGTYAANIPTGFDLIYWEPDGSGGIMPRIPPLAFNYPANAVVLDGTVYGFQNQYTGTLLSAPPGSRPSVVAVDSENGGDAVVTVTESEPDAENDIYVTWWGQNGAQEWQLETTITGNGSATVHKRPGLYAVQAASRRTGFSTVYGVGNVFYVTDATNLTRNRIRDAVASSTLKVCNKLGFQADYQSPGREAVKIWVVPENMDNTLSTLGGEISSSFSVLAPRQVDFPPSDGFVVGARVGVGGVWYAVDVRYPTESVDYAPTFQLTLHRLDDITVEVDGDWQ